MVITFIQHPPCSRTLPLSSGWGNCNEPEMLTNWGGGELGGDFMSPRLLFEIFASSEAFNSPRLLHLIVWTIYKKAFTSLPPMIFFFLFPLSSSLHSSWCYRCYVKLCLITLTVMLTPHPHPHPSGISRTKPFCVCNGSDQHHEIAAWESPGWSQNKTGRLVLCFVSLRTGVRLNQCINLTMRDGETHTKQVLRLLERYWPLSSAHSGVDAWNSLFNPESTPSCSTEDSTSGSIAKSDRVGDCSSKLPIPCWVFFPFVSAQLPPNLTSHDCRAFVLWGLAAAWRTHTLQTTYTLGGSLPRPGGAGEGGAVGLSRVKQKSRAFFFILLSFLVHKQTHTLTYTHTTSLESSQNKRDFGEQSTCEVQSFSWQTETFCQDAVEPPLCALPE